MSGKTWTQTAAACFLFVWGDDFSFERYLEFALDVPMYFAYREDSYLDCTKQRVTFSELLNGDLAILPGEMSRTKTFI